MTSHGPAAAVAPASPAAAAAAAVIARSDGGKPATSSSLVSLSFHALVASSTAFANCVDRLASSSLISLKAACASPSSATPESSISLSALCTIRRCAASSVGGLPSATAASQSASSRRYASQSGRDCW